jgi:hypothetical protein
MCVAIASNNHLLVSLNIQLILLDITLNLVVLLLVITEVMLRCNCDSMTLWVTDPFAERKAQISHELG